MTSQPRTGPLVVAFAAPPDSGVAEAVAGRAGVVVVRHPPLRGAELCTAARAADVLVTQSWQRVERSVLEAGRGRLRAVVQGSAGLDNIDCAAAAAAGVRVIAVDPGNATAVAELTIVALVALLRGIREHWGRTARGFWPEREQLADRELRGKTLGILGLGRVGGRVAQRARAFEAQVLAVDPYIALSAFAERGAERVHGLDELLPRCDALSLHCPLTDETRGLIGERELRCLPRGALLINTARGAIVDEAALARALDGEWLAGAALDVYEDEPPRPGGLIAHPKVLPTPHLGGHTLESHRVRAENLLRALTALIDEWTSGAAAAGRDA